MKKLLQNIGIEKPKKNRVAISLVPLTIYKKDQENPVAIETPTIVLIILFHTGV